jgi:predicted DNA-binding transcriptional regulator AlpA
LHHRQTCREGKSGSGCNDNSNFNDWHSWKYHAIKHGKSIFSRFCGNDLKVILDNVLEPSTYFISMQVIKINEVAQLLRCSIPTIRRRLSEARRGECRFPLPLNRPCGQNLWKLEDIENWTENPPKEPAKKTRHQAMVQRRSEAVGLERHGISVD